MTINLYGIANCDAVKKARAQLAAGGRSHVFVDFKKCGVPAERLDAWLQALGWQALLNRKGTTWRGLTPADRDAVVDADSARALMLREPSLIKRPVVEWADGRVTVGFDPEVWADR